MVLSQHRSGQTRNHPLINNTELLVILGAVFVLIPASGLPFIANLLDDISHEITLRAGSIYAHKLAFVGKIEMTSPLLHLALFGDKVNTPRRVGKSNMSQLKNNGIVTAEDITLTI